VIGHLEYIRMSILERVLLVVFWGYVYFCGKIFGTALKQTSTAHFFIINRPYSLLNLTLQTDVFYAVIK